MEWVKVGEVVHFFGKISVAIIELEASLEVGDWLGFVRDDELLFEQEVTSMQIDYQDIQVADAGDSVGLKTEQTVKVGMNVYKAM